MSMYRCAVCGSTHVISDTKKEGYSVSKGFLGTALFGSGGAVMGINGKDKKYYHCADCGQTLSYTMPDSEKEVIDLYLSNPKSFIELLKEKNEKYPNIEYNNSEEEKKIHNENKISTKFETTEELADAIWEYHIQTKMSYVKSSVIAEIFNKSENLGDNAFYPVALRLLKDRGLITTENGYLTFHDNIEDIKKNTSNQNIKKDAQQVIKENIEELYSILLDLMKVNGNTTYGKICSMLSDSLENRSYGSNPELNLEVAKLVIENANWKHLITIDRKKEDKNNSIVSLLSEEERNDILKKKKEKNNEMDDYLEKNLKDLLLNKYGDIILSILKDGNAMKSSQIKLANKQLEQIEMSNLEKCLEYMNDIGKIKKMEQDGFVYYAIASSTKA